MKEVFAPHLNRNIKLGRLPRKPGGLRLHFSDFVGAALPTPPATCDYTAKAMPVLRDVMLNDQLGDCVIAGIFGHSLGIFTGNAGALYHTSQANILKWYEKIGGYVPGDSSTDQGCNEETALQYAVKTGFPNGTKASGYVVVNASNKTQVMQALDLFENVVLGIALPDAWITPFPESDSAVWDVAGAPDPENGHCVVVVGYDAHGVKVATWGLIITITWAALAKYAVQNAGGEAYALLTPDIIAKGQANAPNGFAWSALVSAFDSLGGNVPVPAPSPTPAPPTPAGPTLQQMESWSNAGLKAHFKAGMTLKQAEAAASAGLAVNWPQ